MESTPTDLLDLNNESPDWNILGQASAPDLNAEQTNTASVFADQVIATQIISQQDNELLALKQQLLEEHHKNQSLQAQLLEEQRNAKKMFDTMQSMLAIDHSMKAATHHAQLPMDWQLHFNLRPQSLRNFDPLPIIIKVLMECPGLSTHSGQIFTILAELYCNALDHGVLALDSSIKDSHKGFGEYYNIRKQKLDAIQEGFISLDIALMPAEVGGRLIFDIKDSGAGFDHKTFSEQFRRDAGFSGRGLPLLYELCESVEFFGVGNHIRAIYRWQ